MRILVKDNTDEKTYCINKQEFLFLVGLAVVARQTAGSFENWQRLDALCPGGPAHFCAVNAMPIPRDCIIHLLPATPETLPELGFMWH